MRSIVLAARSRYSAGKKYTRGCAKNCDCLVACVFPIKKATSRLLFLTVFSGQLSLRNFLIAAS